MSRFSQESRQRLELELLDIAERIHDGKETVSDLKVVGSLTTVSVEDDERAVLPLPSGGASLLPSRGESIEPRLRAFLEVSLGVPIFGMEVVLLNLLLGTSGLLWGSLLWTSFLAALPFEAAWVVVTILRFRGRSAEQ